MGKYSILGRKLKDLTEDKISFTFIEVEGILEFKLPSSARKYRPWWANDRTHSHACDGWLEVGWRVKTVDLSNEIVKFHRDHPKLEKLDQLGDQISLFPSSSLNLVDKIPIEPIDNVKKHPTKRTGSVDVKNQRVLILFPCSGTKEKYKTRMIFDKTNEEKLVNFLDNTKELLLKGRGGMCSYIDETSFPMSALDRYSGYLYSVPGLKELIQKSFNKQDVHFLIMSGAYGLLLPNERIFNYKKPINARYWKEKKLPKVIEEYTELNGITHVYGFFSRTTDYMGIMESIDWQRLRLQSKVALARTYFVNFTGTGGAQKIVPEITGKLIKVFIKSNFNPNNFYENPFNGQFIEFKDHI